MLDLRQLRYFVAAAETQNVGQAAERLGISQSPLSRQIKHLEARLGLALFRREKQRVFLTSDGQQFLVEARELLAHARTIEQRANRVATGHKGSLIIGAVAGAISSQLLPAHVQRFRKRFPNVTLEVRIMRSAAQLLALKESSIDIGYLHSPSAKNDPIVVSHLLSEEPVVLAMPKTHPANRTRRAVSAELLDQQPFISLPPNSNPAWHRDFMHACETVGFTPDIRYEVADVSVALGLVRAGLGLAFVQASLAQTPLPGVSFRRIPWTLPPVRIYCAMRRSTLPIPAAAYANEVLLDQSEKRKP
jgi:DNA-binding transcriptional LysR family regulator